MKNCKSLVLIRTKKTSCLHKWHETALTCTNTRMWCTLESALVRRMEILKSMVVLVREGRRHNRFAGGGGGPPSKTEGKIKLKMKLN